MSMTSVLAGHLRELADRLDPHGAPRRTSWTFTFERQRGAVFREDGHGCPLWYYGMDDYGRAHADSGIPEGGQR